MRALLLFMLTGCTWILDEDPARSICGPRDTRDDATVLARLSANAWFDSGTCTSDGGGFPPSCTRITLDANGHYTWKRSSDYVERDSAGAWSFRTRDEKSGVVCLDDGSVLSFELRDGLLDLGPTGGLSPDPSKPAGGAVAVWSPPRITVDPMYVALIANPWSKTNELDNYRLPEAFELHADGTFDGSLRGGSCTITGTFSLFWENDRLHLWPRPDPNTCDPRNGGRSASIEQSDDLPAFVDGVLDLYSASYRDAAITTSERYLAFSSYGSGDAGLTVRATWDGPLRAGTETRWAMKLENDTSRDQTVSRLRITSTPLSPTTDGFTAAGPTQTLVDHALTETIDTISSLTIDVAFNPPDAAWASLIVEVESADVRQSYRNQRSFIVELPN